MMKSHKFCFSRKIQNETLTSKILGYGFSTEEGKLFLEISCQGGAQFLKHKSNILDMYTSAGNQAGLSPHEIVSLRDTDKDKIIFDSTLEWALLIKPQKD